jgi:hypothetical protein
MMNISVTNVCCPNLTSVTRYGVHLGNVVINIVELIGIQFEVITLNIRIYLRLGGIKAFGLNECG